MSRESAKAWPKSQSAALVLGLDSHALAVVRALADVSVPVYAVEKDFSLPGVATAFAIKTFEVSGFDESHLVPRLLEIRSQLSDYEEVVLIANNDRQVECIGRNLDALLPAFKISWASCAGTILKLQRKDELEAICERQRLNYSRSLVINDRDLTSEASTFRFPVIIKPVRPLSSFKTLMAGSVSELQQLIEIHTKDLPILVQEYVQGDDQSLFFGALVLDRGEVLFGSVGRKIASFPPARGQTTIAETTTNAQVMELTKQFFAGLDLSGPVSLELKQDNNGDFWVIEPTVGRTDFWVKLFIDAGFNKPFMEYQVALSEPIRTPQLLRPVIWYDTERDPVAYIRLCWLFRTFRPKGRYQSFPYLRIDALRPFARAMFRLCERSTHWLWRKSGHRVRWLKWRSG